VQFAQSFGSIFGGGAGLGGAGGAAGSTFTGSGNQPRHWPQNFQNVARNFRASGRRSAAYSSSRVPAFTATGSVEVFANAFYSIPGLDTVIDPATISIWLGGQR
jgi:hypothetical protein